MTSEDAAGAGVIVVRPGETRGKLDRSLKVGGAETGGAYALRIGAGRPPGSPNRWVPEHVHHQEEEAWYVLSGVLTFRIAGQTLEAPAGTFVLVPRGTPHSFGNLGPEPVSFLELFSPAGMEGYFEERLALAEATPRGPSTDFAGLDAATHAALASRYHMEFL